MDRMPKTWGVFIYVDNAGVRRPERGFVVRRLVGDSLKAAAPYTNETPQDAYAQLRAADRRAERLNAAAGL